jgi:hypothetical protein
MPTDYKQTATRMIKATAKSEAIVTTQWGDVMPLKAWVQEFPGLVVANQAKLEHALDHAFLKLSRNGVLKAPDGSLFGGLKLARSPRNTWLLSLYGQYELPVSQETTTEGAM